MSGEFRWVGSSYFYSALDQASDDAEGRHDVSKALTRLYEAVAPVERGCAWYEAGDSGPATPTLALLRQIGAIRDASAELARIAGHAEELIEAAMQEKAA